jgi:hypothetical protein
MHSKSKFMRLTRTAKKGPHVANDVLNPHPVHHIDSVEEAEYDEKNEEA